MNRSLRIAVADDEQDVRDYFCRILPRLGHVVVVAAQNGRELVELCREHQPDLIITDVRMPEADGDEALRQICSEHPTPFILVSAYSKPVSFPNDLGRCAWAHLYKPVKRQDLQAAIENVMIREASGD
jgi:CheY-like chemotaxis protein